MIERFLGLDLATRRRWLREAEAKLGLAARSIEKDLWICWTLRELFALPAWRAQLTFKGGTSLSKCWGLIERFSEDVDIVIERTHLGFGGGTLGAKQLQRLRDACQKRIRDELLPALRERMAAPLAGETWKLEMADATVDPDQQTILFSYPSVDAAAPGYVRPLVRIELGARSETEPSERGIVTTYLAQAFPAVFDSSAIELRTVSPRRTFWEKAMLLHEETYRPEAKRSGRRPRLSRHYYDLWSLIRKGVAAQARADEGLFERVAAHRQAFFRYGWMDYATLHPSRLRLVPPEDQRDYWSRDYAAMREMFFGDPPNWSDVLASVEGFQRELNGV